VGEPIWTPIKKTHSKWTPVISCDRFAPAVRTGETEVRLSVGTSETTSKAEIPMESTTIGASVTVSFGTAWFHRRRTIRRMMVVAGLLAGVLVGASVAQSASGPNHAKAARGVNKQDRPHSAPATIPDSVNSRDRAARRELSLLEHSKVGSSAGSRASGQNSAKRLTVVPKSKGDRINFNYSGPKTRSVPGRGMGHRGK